MKKKWTIIFIIFLMPIGLYTKFYTGIASTWVNNSLGGVIYVIFWSLFLSIIFQKAKPLKIVVIVFLITTIIEIMQLWHPIFLEIIRDNFFGRALFGTSFSYLDIAHYLIGLVLSFWLIKILRKMDGS